MKTLSIDFGSANSLAACTDDQGNIILIRHDGQSASNSDTKHLPSFLAFHPDGSVRSIGQEAKSLAVTHPKEVVWGFKRLLGLPYTYLKEQGELDRFTYDILPDWHDGQCRCAVGKNYTPVELVSIILQKLKKDAEEQAGAPFDSVVLTAPAYFDSSRNSRLKEAARMAGFDRILILAEPVAAAIARNMTIDSSRQITLTCDLGAGTLDISLGMIFRSDDGEVRYETLINTGNTSCGGIDIDYRISRYILDQLTLKEVPADSRGELLQLAEEAKITLSREQEVCLPVDIGGEGRSVTITRDDLTHTCKELLDSFRSQVLAALDQAGYSPDKVDTLILIGGPIILPIFRDLLGDIFSGNARVLRQLDAFYREKEQGMVNRMTATAIGGAMYHTYVSDRCPFGYGFEEIVIRDEEIEYKPEILIPMNAVYPHPGGALQVRYSNGMGLYEFKLIKQVPLAGSASCEYKFVSILKFAVKNAFFTNIVCEMSMNENKELVVRIRNLSRPDESVEYIGADIDPSSEITVQYPIRAKRPKNIQYKAMEVIPPEESTLNGFTEWVVNTLMLSVISSAKENKKPIDRVEPVMKEVISESKRQPVRYQQLFNQAGCLLHNSYSLGMLDPGTKYTLECDLNDWQDQLFTCSFT